MKACKQKSVDAGSHGPLFSMGGTLVKHRGTSLGLAGAVGARCDVGTSMALPHGRVMAAKRTHPDFPAEIFVVLSAFCNAMGLGLENPY